MTLKSALALAFALISFMVEAQQMPRLDMTIGLYRIDAEVAADQGNRMQGLMHRRSMGQHQGMLFVFPEENTHCMWMQNTHIPLSVAFLDREGRIINIENMKPHTEDNHCASRPARYALEMNFGWFAEKGIKPGARLSGIEQAPAPR